MQPHHPKSPPSARAAPPAQATGPSTHDLAWPGLTPANHGGRAKIGRRWLPWRSRTRSATKEAYDWLPNWATPTGDDPISVTLGFIGLIICLPLLIPAFLMTPFFLVESLLQWLVMPFAVLLRMLGVLPVEVDARRGDGALYRERVSGWGQAKERMTQLRHGVPSWHPAASWPASRG